MTTETGSIDQRATAQTRAQFNRHVFCDLMTRGSSTPAAENLASYTRSGVHGRVGIRGRS
jgi:hypothetical protein